MAAEGGLSPQNWGFAPAFPDFRGKDCPFILMVQSNFSSGPPLAVILMGIRITGSIKVDSVNFVPYHYSSGSKSPDSFLEWEAHRMRPNFELGTPK